MLALLKAAPEYGSRQVGVDRDDARAHIMTALPHETTTWPVNAEPVKAMSLGTKPLTSQSLGMPVRRWVMRPVVGSQMAMPDELRMATGPALLAMANHGSCGEACSGRPRSRNGRASPTGPPAGESATGPAMRPERPRDAK